MPWIAARSLLLPPATLSTHSKSIRNFGHGGFLLLSLYSGAASTWIAERSTTEAHLAELGR